MSGEAILSILEAVTEGNTVRLRSVVSQQAAASARQGDGATAKKIMNALEGCVTHLAKIAKPPAIDATLTEEWPLHEEVATRKLRLSDLIIPEHIEEQLTQLLLAIRNSRKLRVHGLLSQDRILLVAPRGYGKTLVIKALASSLGRPLRQVNLKALAKCSPETLAANVRQITNSSDSHYSIWLYEDLSEHLSLEQQQALLGALGEPQSYGVHIVTDTSRPNSLSHHYDTIVEWDSVSASLLMNGVRGSLASLDGWQDRTDEIEQALEGLSPRAVTQACVRASRDAILREGPVDVELLQAALRERGV